MQVKIKFIIIDVSQDSYSKLTVAAGIYLPNRTVSLAAIVFLLDRTIVSLTAMNFGRTVGN